jgi:hypothetical protein
VCAWGTPHCRDLKSREIEKMVISLIDIHRNLFCSYNFFIVIFGMDFISLLLFLPFEEKDME